MKKKLCLFLCICYFNNVFSQGLPVYDALGHETAISNWLMSIEEVYSSYDMIMNTVTQIENQWKQIDMAINNMKGIDWDNINFDDGSILQNIDIRDEMFDAGTRINNILTQANTIKKTLNSTLIKIPGGKEYNLADLCGKGDEGKDYKTCASDVWNHMKESMFVAATDAVRELSDEEREGILAKYGISAENYVLIDQANNFVKNKALEAIGKTTEEAQKMVREEKYAKLSKIIGAAMKYTKLEDGVTDENGKIEITEGEKSEANLYLTGQMLDECIGLREAINNVAAMNAAQAIAQQREKEAEDAEKLNDAKGIKIQGNNVPANFILDSKDGEKLQSNGFIDIPILSAIDYFQGVLNYFLKFAIVGGQFFGLLGILWTAFKLINSRIDYRSAYWDSMIKWLAFVLMLNFYVTGTNLICSISTKLGVNAGNGKNSVIQNFASLKSRIDKDINAYNNWVEGLENILAEDLNIKLGENTFFNSSDFKKGKDGNYDKIISSIKTEYAQQNHSDSLSDYNFFNKNLEGQSGYKFNSSNEIKKFNKKIDDYFASLPDTDNTIWGEQTLKALNSILVIEPVMNPEDATYQSKKKENKKNLSDSYVIVNPELNIWLKDEQGNESPYLSSSAIFRIALLTAAIIAEKSQMIVHEVYNSKTQAVEYKVEKVDSFWNKISLKRLGSSIMAAICAFCIILSSAFFLIQYVMCILEFTIVQGIGAFFIPFCLFDGTKDITKKLIPVFIGFAIKILVMVICLLFVINLYLNFASQQLSPTSGNMSWITVGECIFICLLSFILTSNAPKIAMTLLTGQPQLSMGEFVAAAGTAIGAAAATANVARAVTSPFEQAAKRKAHNWSEQNNAGKMAEKKQLRTMQNSFAEARGIDTSTIGGRQELSKQWREYLSNDDERSKVESHLKNAKNTAVDETKFRQQMEYQKGGGVLGSVGRVFAHYTGSVGKAVSRPKEFWLGQGNVYNPPKNEVDLNRIKSDDKITDLNFNKRKPETKPNGIDGKREIE